MRKSKPGIPEEVYVGFVRSLFNEGEVLLIGGVCHCLLAILVYTSSREPIYLWFAVVLLIAGIVRYFNISGGKKAQITTYEEARRWEVSYLYTGFFQALTMGLFSFVTLYYRPDVFGEIGAVTVVMGSTITIVGRNYGSKKMVLLQSLAIVVPMAAGMILRGGYQFIILGLYLIPFIFVLRKMSNNVQTVLFDAIIQGNRSRRLAQRFDRALNTMSHGLVMFGTDGKVVVANAQAADIMGFSSADKMIGRTLKTLLMRGVAAGMLNKKDSKYAENLLTEALRRGRDRKVLLRLADRRYLEFSARAGRDELKVLTFEEVTQRVEAEEKIRYMARYDSLTGLPNRAYFHDVIAEMMATGDQTRLCGLSVFDLDDFKSINDTLGHPVGDGLIYAVAEKLASFAGDDVKVSRFGGDEFMIFFNQVENEEDFTRRSCEVFESLRGEVDVAGHILRIQVSGGGVLSSVGENSVDAMIVKADLALYKAKEEGKNGWRVFETEMDAAFRHRQTMKADLRTAVETKALRVVFQPIIDLSTMQISSCEALCRWDHAELGAVSPAVFIPLAEEMGLISEISAFVLQEACGQCAQWPSHLCVSVNLSAKDFYSGSVVETVREALSKAQLDPRRLEIEVTETTLLDDHIATRGYLEALKQLGVGIALDDFGTGYSSLSYLHRLPLDKVKIDGSFLADVTNNKRSLRLLTGVVDLSKNLGLAVTVEGVETFGQLKILASSVQADFVQGFLFGSALTSSGIKTMSAHTWSLAGFDTPSRSAIAAKLKQDHHAKPTGH
ncbi:EAL domain-containing protein [Chelativorans sp. AA-79]|uniref:putative bifunctional diguanylate cyclase/phosphodiesterase n=1 Tax=Chelativorans sp. AA-79 TaxID=3028735 RepID=UPI0023F70915|nr:EAL domain-containing protein [Chelativorans sp. AA-79]WEX10182.1 EAL domain-containing protein [Chelativorans sp. AA-79]